MKLNQVRTSFMSTKSIIFLCLLMLFNTVISVSSAFSGISINPSLHVEWFSILISSFVFLTIIGIFINSRKIKSIKISKDTIFIGSKEIKPDNLLKINISHKKIELTYSESQIFKKVIFVNILHPDELNLITNELLEFSTEHKINSNIKQRV